jgi:hypothetical protein
MYAIHINLTWVYSHAKYHNTSGIVNLNFERSYCVKIGTMGYFRLHMMKDSGLNVLPLTKTDEYEYEKLYFSRVNLSALQVMLLSIGALL